jgi:two-component system, LytTR family, response regulator
MSPKIRTLIIDDEPLAREGLRLLLNEDPVFSVIDECENGKAALASIVASAPDLIFLDIQMPGMSGLEMLSLLPSDKLPLVVFVTAHDRYAVDAFEVNALDYLLKPVQAERFRATVARVKQMISERRTKELSDRLLSLLDSVRNEPLFGAESRHYVSRFAIKEQDRVYFVPVDDLDWIGAADFYVQLHAGSKTHLLRESLTNLQEKLDPHRFIRIHRSAIVNVARVKELRRQPGGDYTVVLYDGTHLKTGRSYREQLDALLGDSL